MQSRLVLLVASALLLLCLTQVCADSSADPVGTYIVNLDLVPEQRWVSVATLYKDDINRTVVSLLDTIPADMRQPLYDVANKIGLNIEETLGEYGLEMKGVADATGIDLGVIVLSNFAYELTAECTSIIAADNNGYMYHGRNLDFGLGGGFTEALKKITINVLFQRSGRTIYLGTTFCGYVGLLTGMAQNRWSISVDEAEGEMWNSLLNGMEYILAKNASAISLLIREQLNDETVNYTQALKAFSYTTLIAQVYYILGGSQNSQGAVITRARNYPLNVWHLTPPERWFEVETNYFHWVAPPPSDDRVDPANQGMEKMGRANISSMGIFNVLSTYPVLNPLTTYTTVMRVPTGEYHTVTRNCAEKNCKG